jgi:endogenous inhibitor of DNA gyrase (YacG/DUF329 family)
MTPIEKLARWFVLGSVRKCGQCKTPMGRTKESFCSDECAEQHVIDFTV